MAKSWTDEQFIEYVKNSQSISQVLRKLGVSTKGGSHYTAKRAIQRLGLDTSHFKGQAIHKGKTFGPKRKLEEYLVVGCKLSSSSLRERLIKEGYFERKCYGCDLTEWREKPIPLELEHINGEHDDNRLENLTILCPNCHAQTDTYRGKNIRTKVKQV